MRRCCPSTTSNEDDALFLIETDSSRCWSHPPSPTASTCPPESRGTSSRRALEPSSKSTRTVVEYLGALCRQARSYFRSPSTSYRRLCELDAWFDERNRCWRFHDAVRDLERPRPSVHALVAVVSDPTRLRCTEATLSRAAPHDRRVLLFRDEFGRKLSDLPQGARCRSGRRTRRHVVNRCIRNEHEASRLLPTRRLRS